MKANKILLGAFAALTLMACNGGQQQGPVVVAETRPEVKATEGAYTLVVQFEETPCHPVIVAGNYKDAQGNVVSWSLDNAVKFELCDGKKTWYQAVVYPADAQFDGQVISGKPVQLADDVYPATGNIVWDYQLAKEGLTPLDGDAVYFDENNGEIQWHIYSEAAENVRTNDKDAVANVPASSPVIYAKCGKWGTNPCAEPVPAGNGTFTAKIETALPAGAVMIMTGNFAEEGWGDSKREMTKVNDLTYTWTGDYGENLEWKVLYRLDGYKDCWAKENIKFDGTDATKEATFTFDEPEVAPTVQEGAITVTLKKTDYENVYLWAWTAAGNVFSEEWPGKKLEAVEGVYSYTFAEDQKPVSIIWNNGEGVQTGNIEDVVASTCYEVNGTDYSVVDCE
ncbi:MAG: starch-binding protein [Paludibacteraceae bacterium]|nr:starch-binding protein [Paludibacteraceae bacterium]